MEHHEIINVRLGEGDRSVVLLDQTELPNRVVYRTVTQLADMVEAIHALRRAYKVVYRQGHTVEEALAELAESAAQFPEVAVFRDSIQSATRGITR